MMRMSERNADRVGNSTEYPFRQEVSGFFYDAEGARHGYAYTAVGFAPDDVIERANAREAACRQRR